ncbi:MAG: lysophospholipase [Deltaproteobacteria bacterium]|nr:lysophospholipase [Deltaproteobacteria bacterium]
MAMQATTFRLGQLFVRAWLPEGEPKAVLRIIHGMAEHCGRYARLAEAFVQQGWAVYAHDQRGHGQTAPAEPELGHFADRDGFRLLISDAHDIALETARRHLGKKSVTFAHSMGSFVAQGVMLDHATDATAWILCGSSGRPGAIARVGRALARAERIRVGPREPSKVLDLASFGPYNRHFAPNRTDFDWLSRDNAEVDKYIADPLCGFSLTTQSWCDLLDALDTFLHDPALQRKIPATLPILVTSGVDDPVGEMGDGDARLYVEYIRAGLSNTRLKLYSGARHELVNETNRDEVTRDLLAFASQAVA